VQRGRSRGATPPKTEIPIAVIQPIAGRTCPGLVRLSAPETLRQNGRLRKVAPSFKADIQQAFLPGIQRLTQNSLPSMSCAMENPEFTEVEEHKIVNFTLQFQKITESGNQSFDLPMSAGDVVFVVGANGTGKSSLIQQFYIQHPGPKRRISAHRQTWFESNSVTMAPSQKRNYEQNVVSQDNNHSARWKEWGSSERTGITIFDLIDAQNIRARGIADSYGRGDLHETKRLNQKEAPLSALNELLQLSNIPISIAIEANESLVARKNGGQPFSVAQLSDGERNALLMAGDVLTAKPGSFLLIDEPERHLHRSIISPLLTLLFERRKDCAFVISTHDVDLAIEYRDARQLLVRSCRFSGEEPQAWDVDLMTSGAIDADLKHDILGARRKMLFVEGNTTSLDNALYSIVFPQVSVISKEACRQVEQSVLGVNEVSVEHWVQAWGIVDNDGHDLTEVNRKMANGIYSVPFYSVESIYYHPAIIQKIAALQTSVQGGDASAMIQSAVGAAITSLDSDAERLSLKSAEKSIRRAIFSALPNQASVKTKAPVNISVDTAAIVEAKAELFTEALSKKDWIAIITSSPIRESKALNALVKELGFQKLSDYEKSVRKLLLDDSDALQFVRNLFPGLYEKLSVG
jgi:ABC-type cobalamin/Fe3+-siderophores transport system ATPase subunit